MDFYVLITKLIAIAIEDIINEKLGVNRPRKDFSESTKHIILAIQRNRCNNCRRILDVVNFDHVDDNRSNNHITNCRALCPNCHAKKTRRRNRRQQMVYRT